MPEAEILAIVLDGKPPPVRRYHEKVKITVELKRILPAQAMGPLITLRAGKQTADSLSQTAGRISGYLDRMPDEEDSIRLYMDLAQAEKSVSECRVLKNSALQTSQR